MKVKQHFDEIIRQRVARKQQKPRLSRGQDYVVKHLREQHALEDDEENRRQLNTLIDAYSDPVPQTVKRRLNRLRRNNVEGSALQQRLRQLYTEYRLAAYKDEAEEEVPVPRIVCSESLSYETGE